MKKPCLKRSVRRVYCKLQKYTGMPVNFPITEVDAMIFAGHLIPPPQWYGIGYGLFHFLRSGNGPS